MTRLEARGVTLAYEARTVSRDLDVAIPDGSFTVVVGPNACGKSTLLRGLARMIRPSSGTVSLDDRPVADYGAKEFARRLALLPQSPVAPDGIGVADLVARGRYPHQSLLRQWSPADEEAVSGAMAATGVAELAERAVGELSGGQRQRVWIAMVLAQDTPLLLLDEPTTFLDIAYQLEVLDLLADLHAAGDRTLVAVLHDLNQACRYATHLIAMRDGAVVAEGPPSEIVDADLLERVFGLIGDVVPDPRTGTPMIIPAGREARQAMRAGVSAATGHDGSSG
ncbi:ABC transporter ATP-binding protein [Actinomycetospora termitidis]|uniref:ABC transporter ATP-binding protein n=1 Tax=Actinomycetospora termitidis TaxID=3053470 RepID=A0ABT7MFT9_9PSEU|nr:ABC transporter ATP-binding protein [Actinomycetospora sp. Odt1-22]MDL5159529.1 ABC transporter ATP-binding protein [Actinomycetospora sp. Odt1-22]